MPREAPVTMAARSGMRRDFARPGRAAYGMISVVKLGDLTWEEVAGRSSWRLILPLGATEQHGPHLPIDTDTRIATALADDLARRRHDAIVAPSLAYGSSGEHRAFPGTLSLGQAGIELALVELVRSADHFKDVVVVSWHGGNVAPVTRAAARLRAESRSVNVWQPRHEQADLHAGRTETSLMLWLAPERVREDRPVGSRRPLAEIGAILQREGVAAVAANGVLGDARGASPDEGRQLFAQFARDLEWFASACG